MLRVLAARGDGKGALVRGGVDEHDLVAFLDRNRDIAPIGRNAVAFGRSADRHLVQGLATGRVDKQQAAAGLVGNVGGLAVRAEHGAARLGAGRYLAYDLVGGGVDHAQRGRAFVRHIGQWRRTRGGAQQAQKKGEQAHGDVHGFRRKVPYNGVE